MIYNILDSKIEFKDNRLHTVAVLVEVSEGDIRAMFVDTKPKSGYAYLKGTETFNEELLQKIAGYGLEIEKDGIFPDWQSKLITDK